MLVLIENDKVLDTWDMTIEEISDGGLEYVLELGLSIQGVKLVDGGLYYTTHEEERLALNNRDDGTVACIEVDSEGLLTHLEYYSTSEEPLVLARYSRGISSNFVLDVSYDSIIFTPDLILPDRFSLDLDNSSVDGVVFDLTCLGGIPFVTAFCREYFDCLSEKGCTLSIDDFDNSCGLLCDSGIYTRSLIIAFLRYGYGLFELEAGSALSSYSDETCRLYKRLYFHNLFEIPKYARNNGINLPYIRELSKSELTKLSKALYKSEALQGIIDTLVLFIGVFNVPETLQNDILQILRS